MKVLAYDLDGTLLAREKPIQHMIEEVNAAFEDADNFIVIYTARSYTLFHQTRSLLLKYGIKHHALVMEKMRANCYIDDRARKP